MSATGFPAPRGGPARVSRRFDLATALTHLILIAACLTILLPILWTARTSFASRRIAYDPATLLFVPTLDNYAKIFVEETFLKYFWNSLWIGLASALFSLAVGSLAAYSIARFRTGGQPFSLTVLGTQMLPPVALVIPFYLLAQRFGLLDKGWALALVYLSFNLPFVVWILIGFFQGIPRELEEAALVDGSGRLGAFWRIIVPLSLPGMLAAGVWMSLASFQSQVLRS